MNVQQPPQPSVTPETDVETETLTLRGPNKRTRDDELRQLEVDKARLDLDRLRKTTEFEEQQRLRETAFQEDRRAKELAFEEERRAHERELHQQKLAHLVATDSPNDRQATHEDDEGEIPLEAQAVSLQFPIAPQKELAAIFEGKFDPTNLYKLRGKVSLSKDDDDEEISVSGGKLRAKKRSGTLKDYQHPSVWSAAFLEYIAITSKFKTKYDDLTHPLILFHNRIMELSNTYSWEAVLILALTFHKERIVMGINDTQAWRMSPTIVDEHLRNNLKPTKSSLSSRPVSGNSYCMNWNKGDCNWAACRRKHACSRCGKSHKEKDHPKEINRS